jgi:hypothetical protein
MTKSVRKFCRLGALILCSALASAAQAKQYSLIVGGLGGEDDYEQRFRKQATELGEMATHADDQAQVVTLAGPKATRAAIKEALTTFANGATVEDRVTVTLIGHGTYDGEEYRFNIPGPDVTASDLREWMLPITARQQLVVVATSASGAAVPRLQKDQRIVITATKSGGERNAVRFAEYWVQAMRSTEADRDKNEWVTAQEAYDYAVRKVTDAFKTTASLATEHARIEGKHAESLPLGRLGNARLMPTDAALTSLFAERLRTETEFEAIKARKQEMQPDAYYSELEKTLITLAKTQQRIDAREAALVKEGGR